MKVVLQNLTKVFPNRDKKGTDVIAVNDFTFEIPDGKLVGLLGPSGCGKSTTLYMISGLLTPSAGRIFFGDEDVTDVSTEKRGIGLVFQNYALYPHMTVRQNIIFPLQNLKGAQKLDKKTMQERVEAAAKLVQLDGLLDRKPNELSGGQQQRVAIARALVKMPKVLLLDEPLSNLDARLRLQTREEIRRIQKQTGITTVFVTHDQEEAMSISDMIVVMKEGAVQQIGKPQDVYDDPANLFVAKFLGTPPINVFDGKIEGGYLWIGNDQIFKAGDVSDQTVTVAVRPEGYEISESGLMTCRMHNVEIMGRDISVVASHDAACSETIRMIVGAEQAINVSSGTVQCNIKPGKCLVFHKETEERIRCDLKLI